MQSPMISIPLKETDEVDWTQPLKDSIQTFHSLHPGQFTEECALLQRLRQDIRGVNKESESSRDLLYRYCGQLELLDRRFTVDENHVKISFTWYDAFTQKPTSQYSLAYEKACVIFNIAALLSSNASARNRDAEDGLKKVWHEFQLAAGMLRYLNENFQYAPSMDLDRNTVSTLDVIMLAQAQEAFLERQIRRKTKVLMVAKLAGHAASLWAQAVEGVQENVSKGVFDHSWLLLVQCKASLFASLAQHYQAMADTSGEKGKVPNYGAQIVRLQVALRQAAEAKSIAKKFPKSCPDNSNLGPETASALMSVVEKHWLDVKEQLDEAKKDNDKIYHQAIPSETSLSAVETLSSATPTRISKAEIDEIIGPDIFQKLVPMWIVESASLYEFKKDKIRQRLEGDFSDIQKEAVVLDATSELPSLLDMLRGGSSRETLVFKEFKDLCEKIADLPSANQIMNEMAYNSNQLRSNLEQSSQRLEKEEKECEELRLKHGRQWTQQRSSELTAMLWEDIQNFSKALDEGIGSDEKVLTQCREFESKYDDMRSAGIEMQSQGRYEDANTLFHRMLDQAIFSQESCQTFGRASSTASSLIDEDFEDRGRSIAQQVKDLDESLARVETCRQSVSKSLDSLAEQAKEDNIVLELIQFITNKKAISDENHPLFKARLVHYEKPRAVLNEWLEQLRNECTNAELLYNRLKHDKRIRRDMVKMEAFKEELKIYQNISTDMERLQQKIQEARQFYLQMQERIENLSQNITTFVSNRESERTELLRTTQGQQSTHTTTSNAEHDKARLTELMERMNFSSALPVAPNPLPLHHRPAPLKSTPAYHQTYNPAKSPPLSASLTHSQHTSSQSPSGLHSQQQRYTQAGRTSSNTSFIYDPTHYGPVSPPPGQQSFSHNPSYTRGHPMPNYSQQHSPVPAGFVPPPPPPGPPPNKSASIDRNNNDPWDGLSGWK